MHITPGITAVVDRIDQQLKVTPYVGGEPVESGAKTWLIEKEMWVSIPNSSLTIVGKDEYVSAKHFDVGTFSPGTSTAIVNLFQGCYIPVSLAEAESRLADPDNPIAIVRYFLLQRSGATGLPYRLLAGSARTGLLPLRATWVAGTEGTTSFTLGHIVFVLDHSNGDVSYEGEAESRFNVLSMELDLFHALVIHAGGKLSLMPLMQAEAVCCW